MATLKEVEHTALKKEPRTQEDAAGDKTPERRHVDALLDVSEEDFLKELEPHEYHCYSGWEEAVRGWARVAPLSCILLTQKRYGKAKHKEADNPSPLSVDPTVPNADSSASIAEHLCESGNSFKPSMTVNQHTGSWRSTAVAAQQKDATERPVLGAMQKTTLNLLLEERTEEGPLRGSHHLSSKYTVLENRPTKPQKNHHRANNTVVPIRNFTFLPPIKSPHLNLQKASGRLCSDKKAPEEETMEENSFMLDKRSGPRGTRAEPCVNPELPTYCAGRTFKYQTCQHNPHLFNAVTVSVPKRYQVPMSSSPDTLHRTRYSMGKSLTQALHAGTAAGAQAHMHPSKTVCAVTLFEGCEINV